MLILYRKVIHYGDLHTFATQEADELPSFGVSLSDILKRIQSRFSMERYQRIVPVLLKKGLEDNAAAKREQVLLKSEFKRFSQLPDSVVQRALIQIDFEKLFQERSSNELEFNLDAWCWTEQFDKSSLVQVRYILLVNDLNRFCKMPWRHILTFTQKRVREKGPFWLLCLDLVWLVQAVEKTK